MRTLVVGVGNPVRGDDAVGLHAARLARAALAGTGVDVGESFAGGLELAEAMIGYERAVVIDAMATGCFPAGGVVRLALRDLRRARNVDGLHDMSLPTALDLLGRLGVPVPSEVHVVAVEAERFDGMSEDLTPAVAAAAPRAAALARELALAAAEAGR